MVNPLRATKYTGMNQIYANFVERPRRPLTSDYRQPENAKLYRISTVWQVGKNPSTGTEGELWMLSKIVANVATWIMLSGGNVGTVVSVTGDDGVITLPDGGGNIDLVGNVVANATHAKPVYVQTGGANTEQWDIQLATAVAPTPLDANDAGLASFNNTQFTVDPTSGMVSLVDPVDNDLHWPKFIVGDLANGANYATISSAYAAAVLAGAPQTIALQDGTYTENITLTAGINIAGFTNSGPTSNIVIQGKLTATQSGSVSISGVRLKTNGDYVVESTGANAATVNIFNCNIEAFNNTSLRCTNANAAINVRDSNFQITGNGIANFSFTAGNHVFSFNNNNGGGNNTPATISGGSLIIKNSQFQHGITTSGTAALHLVNVQMGDNRTPVSATMLTVGGSGEHDAVGCLFLSDNAAAITISSTLTLANSTVYSNAVNVITGAGTIRRGLIAFTGTGSTITTATQTALVTI